MVWGIRRIVSNAHHIFSIRVMGQKTKVSLTLSQATLSLNEDGEEQIPKDHRLDVSPIAQQTLGVFSHMTRK